MGSAKSSRRQLRNCESLLWVVAGVAVALVAAADLLDSRGIAETTATATRRRKRERSCKIVGTAAPQTQSNSRVRETTGLLCLLGGGGGGDWGGWLVVCATRA